MARFQYFLRIGIIPFFIAWKAIDFVVASVAGLSLPYYGHFSHPSTLTSYNIPQWIKGFAQFDGIFYLRIAQNGYSQFEQAFFPLYPILIGYLSPLFGGNYLFSSLFIANGSFLVGLILFKKYLIAVLKPEYKNTVGFIIVSLLLYPTSFFFGSAYTEGIFFLLVVSVFFFLHQKNYLLVALFAFLASLTRFIGLFLFIPIIISVFQNAEFNIRIRTWIFAVISPFLGLASYMWYLLQSTGDPLSFFTSQSAFGAGRSTELVLLPQVVYRYIKILLTTGWNLAYFIALLELFAFLLVFAVLILQLRDMLRSKNRTLLGLNLFSLSNLLIPTLTGTFLSIPRFSLLSLSFFIYIGLLKNTVLRAFLCIIFFLIHVVLVTLFIQGYFVS